MTEVTDALILMAGSGSRLRAASPSVIKPLVPILGRPLISYTLEALLRAGIKNVYTVIGFEGEAVSQAVEQLVLPGLSLRFIENPYWQKQNGISVLAAAPFLANPFVLTMSDHLFDQAIIDRLIAHSAPDQLNLAVDRKLDSIFDRDDAMKVQTSGEQIVALGKHLREFDAIDTGIFVCPPEIFVHLERASARADGDCSLADGVRSMAAEGRARVVDIGDAWWQDVDTAEMHAEAERHLRARSALAD